MKGPVCVDCIAEGVQAYRAPHASSGPRANRCTTHHRARKKAVKEAAHGARVQSVYGISAAQYEALYVAQGGRCYVCRHARGISKKLCVDHDHKTGLVRGLACTNCNRWVLGLGSDALLRGLQYLHDPPAVHVIGAVFVPTREES